MKSILVFALITGSVVAEAKPAKMKDFVSKYSGKQFTYSVEAPEANDWVSELEMPEKNYKRMPSSNLSPERDVEEFKDSFLAVKDAKGLDKLFEKYEKLDPKKTSADLKFFLSQIRIFKSMRGIIWRLRPIVETKGFAAQASGSKAVHSMTVSLLRGLSGNLAIYNPSSSWQAGFDYISAPSESMTPEDQFTTVSEFQNFVGGEILPKVIESRKQIEGIVRPMMKAKTPVGFVWDNQIAYGEGSFSDGIRQYFLFQEPEALATLGSLHMLSHSIYVFLAFNTDDMTKVFASLGRLQGVDSFIPGQDLGVSSAEKYKVIRKYANTGYLSLHKTTAANKSGQELMKLAYLELKSASKLYQSAYKYLQVMNEEHTAVFNPVSFQMEQRPLLRLAVNNMVAAVGKKDNFKSPVTGEEITLDVKNFYNSMPANFNLTQMMPTGFKEGGPGEKVVVNKDNKQLTYRDYSIGRPTAWNNNAWARLVPSAQGQKAGYVAEVARVVKFTPGLEFLNTFVGRVTH